MYTDTYRIAGQIIRICSLHEQVQKMCADYRFEGQPDILVEMTQQLIEDEREKSRLQDERDGLPAADFPDDYLETLAVYRSIADQLLHRDTLLFHGSVIAVDGKAYLFTAKSGTGKSTHTRLWREMLGDRAVMVNDDKPLLKFTQDGVLACGTPWNGKHHLGENIMVPLAAICILERGEVNAIRPVTVREALPRIIEQSHKPDCPADRALD